jgi:dienelactone hydrolase
MFPAVIFTSLNRLVCYSSRCNTAFPSLRLCMLQSACRFSCKGVKFKKARCVFSVEREGHMKRFILLVVFGSLICASQLWAQTQRVVDIPTRHKVTQRIILLEPDTPKAAAVLFAGGHGGLQVSLDGDIKWGKGNFLVRSRQLFASSGVLVAVVDAPSDRQNPPYLDRFRQTPEHVADIRAVVDWLKKRTNIPVWLVGTSRGAESAAFIATQLTPADDGPDGIVLTATMLTETRGNRPVPEMPLDRVRIPVLVVHHKQDGCEYCRPADLPRLMNKLTATPQKELITFDGGKNVGDPCEAMAYHGFNGIEREVVRKIADWIMRRSDTRQ